MSDKDYAPLNSTQVESKRASQSTNPKPILIATLGTMLAIICFSVGFFLGEKYSSEGNQSVKYEALLANLHQQQEENKSLKKEAEKYLKQKKEAPQVGELTFYNELPNQSIIPEPLDDSKAPSTAIKPKAATVFSADNSDIQTTEEQLNAIIAEELNSSSLKFRIQIASFKRKKDAETLVEQLKEIDIQATIKRVNLVKLGTRYRVNTTPFNQHRKALRAKQLVKEMFDITAIIITQ